MKKVLSIILTIILIVLLGCVLRIYSLNNFGEFLRAEMTPYTSKFTRDSSVKYSKANSYKIESNVYNDALFHKEVSVKPNTPYKITAMVKTENVLTEDEGTLAGAQICIFGTTESSRSITGTSEFTKLEFIIDSKNRDKLDICFRLGGYDNNVKGTAWFSDFTIEEGAKTMDNTWNFACLIMDNVDVNVDIDGEQKNIKLNMGLSDKQIMKDDMARFKNAIRELSGNNMMANYDIIEVEEPLTKLSHSEENAYFIEPKDILEILDKYCKDKEYDHIFIVVRLRR